MTLKGFNYLMVATVAYGILHVIDKAALSGGVDSTAYTISRVFIAALMLGGIALATQQNVVSNLFRAGSLRDLVIIGTLASGWGLLLQIQGLSLTSATNTALLLTLVAPVTTFFAVLILKEELFPGLVISMLVMIAGICCVYGLDQATSFGAGDTLILIAVLGYGMSNVLVRKTMNNVPATIVTLGRLLFGSLSIAILIPVLATPLASVTNAPFWTLLGGIVFGVRMTAYHKGIQHEGASVAATFLLFSPLVTELTAKIALGEFLTTGTVVGTVLTAVGGWILVASSIAKRRTSTQSPNR